MSQSIDIPYDVRPCVSQDEPGILGLLETTVGETDASRKTSEYWAWKHANSPFGPSYVVGAFDSSGEIGGLRALMRWRFCDLSGSIADAVRPVDTATHPAHQRRGIFSALTRFAIDEVRAQGVHFVFNTPNANSLPGYLKMGWTAVARWPMLMRPVRPLAFCFRMIRRHLPGSTATRTASCDPAFLEWSEFRQRHGATFDELITDHETNRLQVGYRTPRNAEYLDWRYGAQPNVAYGVHVIGEKDRLEGIVIARRAPGHAGTSSLVLTEMFVRHPSVSSCKRLLRSLLNSTTADYLTAHAATGTLEHRAMRRLGFVRAPGRGYTFVSNSLNPATLDPSSAASWDLTLGELEIF